MLLMISFAVQKGFSPGWAFENANSMWQVTAKSTRYSQCCRTQCQTAPLKCLRREQPRKEARSWNKADLARLTSGGAEREAACSMAGPLLSGKRGLSIPEPPTCYPCIFQPSGHMSTSQENLCCCPRCCPTTCLLYLPPQGVNSVRARTWLLPYSIPRVQTCVEWINHTLHSWLLYIYIVMGPGSVPLTRWWVPQDRSLISSVHRCFPAWPLGGLLQLYSE